MSASVSTGVMNGSRAFVPRARVLLMAEEAAHNAACTKVLESSGCEVRSCCSYVELLLYLEHESFQLVMVIESENSENQWREVIRQVAETDHGTPVAFLNGIPDGRTFVGLL